MPRRAPRSKAKRGGMRKRRAAPRRRQMTNANRGLQPIPARYICKMKYSSFVRTDLAGQYLMNLNSVYDPDRSGLGHQPYGFDTLSTLYNRYRVIACGWVIQRAAGTAEASAPTLVGCMPSNDPGINFSNFDYLRENPRAKWVLQNPGAQVNTLRGKSYIPSLVGRTRAQYMADDSYQANVLSNPTENAILYIQTNSAVTQEPVIADVSVILEYTVEFYDQKHLLQS